MTQSQKIILGVVIFVVVRLHLVFLGIIPGLRKGSPAPFSLEVWGFSNDDEAWREIIKQFQKQYSYITVKYKSIDETDYQNMLLNRLAEDTGPDVFILKNSWLGNNKEKIYPLPQQALSLSINSFDTAFVDVAHEDLIDKDGVIYGIPLYVDSLALFYNKDLFNAAGVAQPPQTWDDFVAVSKLLTQISPAGDITRSGAALGSGKNVEHAFEIASAMMLQKGDHMVTSTHTIDMNQGSEEALSFYASFGDRTKQTFTWSSLLPNSLDAFAEEKTAMMFGFTKDIQNIKIKNPHINMGIAPFPQLQGTTKPSTLGNYGFATVSKLSSHQIDAWNFILFATSKASAEQYIQMTGFAPARRDILTEVPPPLDRELFWRQALIAKSWPVPDYPSTKKLFEDIIESVSARSVNVTQAFNQLKEQMRLLVLH